MERPFGISAKLLPDETVLGGVQGCGGPARHADFRVDVLDVVRHYLRRQGEPLGDLPVGPPAREQAEYVDLASGQPVGPGTPHRGPLPGRVEHHRDGVSVEPTGTDLGRQLGRGRSGVRASRYGRGSSIAW